MKKLGLIPNIQIFKMCFRKPRIYLVLTTFCLTLLSNISGFWVTDVRSINFDIATMLTPLGFINNLFLNKDSYLKPYYQEMVQRGDVLTDYRIGLLVFIIVLFGVLGLIAVRKELTNER